MNKFEIIRQLIEKINMSKPILSGDNAIIIILDPLRSNKNSFKRLTHHTILFFQIFIYSLSLKMQFRVHLQSILFQFSINYN